MRVLYINTSYDFCCGVNAIRPYDILTYFSSRNIPVTHITPVKAFQFKNVKNIVIPYSEKRRESMYEYFFKSLYSTRSERHFEEWVKDVIECVVQGKIRGEEYDTVFINIQPMCIVKIGIFLKKKYGIKMFIDMHDSFAFNPYRTNLPIFDNKIQKYEEQLFRYADGIITFVPSMYRLYKERYPLLNIHFIPHAISLSHKNSDINKGKRRYKDNTFNIFYGGSLQGGRGIFVLLKAIRKIQHKLFTTQVIGNVSWLTKVRYLGYNEINWIPLKSHTEYLQTLHNEADIGVVCQSFNTRDSRVSTIAAKTYDYLALNKAIVYIGPEGDNADIIRKYSRNYCVVTDVKKDKERLRKYLQNFKMLRNNTAKTFFADYRSSTVYGKLVEILKNSV